jgi:hypothetical protein
MHVYVGSKKFQISAQNLKGLAFGLTKKFEFATKIDENSIFFGRELHMSDRLHINVLYIYMFL